MSWFDKLDRFHQTRKGLVFFGVAELLLAYVFISWAIDSGSWIDYVLALILFVGFLQNAVRFVASFFKPQKAGHK